MELLLSIIVVSSNIYSFGLIFERHILNRKENLKINFFEIKIYGFILLSFLILLINFFSPINKSIGTILIFFASIYFIYDLFKNNFKIKLIKKILVISLITFILLSYSNIYRPDSGLYHLPFISILHENKIIFGLTNLHQRFGHISIIQYTSSALNNYIIPLESLSIPTAILYSVFTYYLFSKLRKLIKNNKLNESLIYFLLFIISIYSYNRFGEYGNDTPGHIFFLVLFIYILTKNNTSENFSNIILFSTFLFLIKPFMLILFFLVLYLFFQQNNKKEIFINRKIIFSVIFLILWIIKNFITSSCLVYPISKLCFENLEISDAKKTKIVEIEGEAWSKDWSNYSDNVYNMKDYNKKFRWLNTWYKNHFKIFIEKITPITIFLFIIYIILFFFSSKSDRKYKYKDEIRFSLFLFFCILVWFLKFPIYRYGSSFIIAFLVCLFLIFSKRFNFDENKIKIKFIYNFFAIIAIIGFLGKNLNRIFENHDYYDIFPSVRLKNNQTEFARVLLPNKGYYFFSNGKLCMYSPSPCTMYNLENISHKTKFNYKIFYKKKN